MQFELHKMVKRLQNFINQQRTYAQTPEKMKQDQKRDSPWKALWYEWYYIDKTVFRNPDTRKFSGEWLPKFTKSYQKHYGVKLDILRWNTIADEYLNKKGS